MITAAEDAAIRVLYDISVLGAAKLNSLARTGVYRYVDEIAKFLCTQKTLSVNWGVFGNEVYLPAVRELVAHNPIYARPIAANTLAYGAYRLAGMPVDLLAKTHAYPLVKGLHRMLAEKRTATTSGADILAGYHVIHSPFHPLPPPAPQQQQCVRFLTIHDLIPDKFPQFFSSGVVEQFRKTVASIHADDWILCNSESTRQDLLKSGTQVLPEHVRVTPLAASEHFSPCYDTQRNAQIRSNHGIDKACQYFLSLCTIEPRKNLNHLIEVFTQTFSDTPDVVLVLVGAIADASHPLTELNRQFPGKVIYTGFIPDDELTAFYSDAIAFVYPTLYEGFGLPVLEAMQCGTPVISSNNSSLPEVVGDAGIMVEATSGPELAVAMRHLQEDAEMRSRYRQRGIKRAGGFSWERCGELTVATYHEALDQNQQQQQQQQRG